MIMASGMQLRQKSLRVEHSSFLEKVGLQG